MDFTGAIFDMDGTLLDSMGVWRDITAKFLQRRGLSLPDTMAQRFRDMTLEESLPLIVEMFQLTDPVEQVFDEFSALAKEEYMHNILFKPYAKAYLEKLRSAGVKIAVATSGYDALCRAALKRLGALDYIDAIALSSEVGVNKGNPHVYLLAAERIGVPPADCMVFEDILLGIGGAKKAGMRTTAVADPSNENEWAALRQAADFSIESWAELL